MKLYINNKLLIENCIVANNFILKLLGKIFLNEPLLIKNRKSIHTFFMKNHLDLICLDKNKKIIKIYNDILPNKIVFTPKNTKYIIECDTGFSKSVKMNLGQEIVFKE